MLNMLLNVNINKMKSLNLGKCKVKATKGAF